jgi:RecA-family ATPase
MLASDLFNVERDRDRTHLANSAHKRLSPQAQRVVPVESLRLAVDEFCGAVWEVWLDGIPAGYLDGDPERKPMYWLLEPWIAQKGGTILYGPPGVGKSYTALLWTVAVDAGLTERVLPFGAVRKQAAVLYVNLERSTESLAARIARVNEVLGLPPRRPILVLSARGATLDDVAERITRLVADRNVGLVVLDSLSRAGRSLIRDDAMNAVMDQLNSWGVSWLALAHTAKANRDSPEKQTAFGSQMQDAAADLMVKLVALPSPQRTTVSVALELTKANDAESGIVKYLSYEFNENGLARVRRAESREIAVTAAYAGNDRDFIMEVLRDGAKTLEELAEVLGRDIKDFRVATGLRSQLNRLAAAGVIRKIGDAWGLAGGDEWR